MQLFRKVFFVFIFVHSSVIFSIETNSSRIEKLEKEIDDLRQELHELMFKQARPSANPDIMSEEWFVFLEPMYWYERTNGTAFAYSNNTQVANAPLRGRTKDIDFGYSWGVRVGGGKNIDFDKWDLSAALIYYNNHVSGSTRSGQASTLIPLRGTAVTNTGVSHAKSNYALDFYNLDAELGRHYYVSAHLSFRPFIGLKSAWIDQRQVIRYTGGSLSLNTATVKDYCNYWGLGTKGGVNSRWHLGYGWHLEGLIAGSLLYGYFDIDHKEKISTSIDDQVKLEDNKHRFVPMVHWRLGLTWGTYFNKKQNYATFGASYEGMYWWRQNQMLKVYEYNSLRYDNFAEDLSMHGLTLSAKLYF